MLDKNSKTELSDFGSRHNVNESLESLNKLKKSEDGFRIPEEEIWCYNPTKVKYSHFPIYYRDWLHGVFDDFNSPLYSVKGQIFAKLGVCHETASKPQPEKNSSVHNIMTLSQSESVPSLNTIKPSNTFDGTKGKLSNHGSKSKLTSSRGNSHSPPVPLLSESGEFCRMAKKQEDILKAQVAALTMRNNEQKSSYKSANQSPSGSNTQLNASTERIPAQNKYFNVIEDAENILNHLRQSNSSRQNTINLVSSHFVERNRNDNPIRVNDPSIQLRKFRNQY